MENRILKTIRQFAKGAIGLIVDDGFVVAGAILALVATGLLSRVEGMSEQRQQPDGAKLDPSSLHIALVSYSCKGSLEKDFGQLDGHFLAKLNDLDDQRSNFDHI